jgi:hypothetical protein
MDGAAYENLLRKIRILCIHVDSMDKILLDMFINDFKDMNEHDQMMQSEREMLPS